MRRSQLHGALDCLAWQWVQVQAQVRAYSPELILRVY
jgi:hypothetical protein